MSEMKEKEAKPSPVNRFLSQLGRLRSRSPTPKIEKEKQPPKEKDIHFKVPEVPKRKTEKKCSACNPNAGHSDQPAPPSARSQSPLQRLVHRLSGRRSTNQVKGAGGGGKGKENEPDMTASQESLEYGSRDAESVEPVGRMPQQTPPRPARSVDDISKLRHVTIQRGSDLPVTPLVGATTFMSASEDNLATVDCGAPVQKVPSYLKISLANYGYSSSPRKLENSPIQGMGQSIVERRLAEFERKPAVSTNHPDSTAYRQYRTAPYDELRTPTRSSASRSDQSVSAHSALSPNTMGAHLSTPSPVKSLIGQFDRFNLCSDHKEKDVDAGCEKEGKENIQPQLVINQPQISEVEKSPFRPVDREAVPIAPIEKSLALPGTEESEGIVERVREEAVVRSEEATKVSGGVEPTQVVEEAKAVASVIQVKPMRHSIVEEQADTQTEKKGESDMQVPSSDKNGEWYADLSKRKSSELKGRSDAALAELNGGVEDLPEDAADCIRMASGKANLLLRKKLSKFDELVKKNMTPILNDPQPVTVDDLEGYWAMVEIEMKDIEECFEKVDEYRKNGWKEMEKKPEPVPVPPRSANGAPRKPPTASVRPATTANPEKQKAEQARRKQMIADARAKARQQKEAAANNNTVPSPNSESLMVL